MSESPIDLKSWTFEKALAEGVDRHFNARLAGTSYIAVVGPSTVWTSDWITKSTETGRFTVPTGYNGTAVYSKHAYRYPDLLFRAQIDQATAASGETFYMGLECGGQAGQLIAAWKYEFSDLLYFGFQTYETGAQEFNVSSFARPAGYNTGIHTYRVNLTENLLEAYVDGVLRFVGVPGRAAQSVAGPPYTIACLGMPGYFPAASHSLVEFQVQTTPKSELIDAANCRFFEGDRIRSRQYELYDTGTNTKWSARVVGASTTLNSHPFPAIGYAAVRKMFLNLSALGGTVTWSLQGLGLDGIWRAISSPALVAGYNEVDLLHPFVMMRMQVITSAGSGVTIDKAEVQLA